MSNAKKLNPGQSGQFKFLAPNSPTPEAAWAAAQELIYLQQLFPMLRTHEEQQNNLRKSQRCLETMNRFILAQYLKSTEQEPVH